MSDPFEVLGIPRDATEDQIKTAFRKLAMQYHPDRNPGDAAAEEKFKQVNAAYEELKDPERRAAAQARSAGRYARFDFEFHDPFSFDQPTDFDSILRNVHRAFKQRPRNADVHVQCRITLEEAFYGVEKSVNVTLSSGRTRTIIINIPPGVDTGSRLRVPGSGDDVFSSSPPGDIYITVEVDDHPYFDRVAQNLTAELEVSAIDAILGTSVVIESIDKKEIVVKVPAGIQNGQRLRIAGMGMPVIAAPHARGDLILIVNVTVPTRIPDTAKELLEKARAEIQAT